MSLARGTSNGNCSGNSAARRARKRWLVKTYKANTDVIEITWSVTDEVTIFEPETSAAVDELVRDFNAMDSVVLVELVPACRCFRCGKLLTVHTVTADRIIPGDQGGTYAHENIRPACGPCNSITGNEYRWEKVRKAKEKAERRALRVAAKKALTVREQVAA